MQVMALFFSSKRGGDPDGDSFKYLRSAKAAALYVEWYIALNSSSSAEVPGAGVSARSVSGAGVAFDASGSSPDAGLVEARVFERWKP